MWDEWVLASLNVLKEHTKRSVQITVPRVAFSSDPDVIRRSKLQTKAGKGTDLPIFEREADSVPIGHDAMLFCPSTSASHSLLPHSPSHV
jgi:hypothetical protein